MLLKNYVFQLCYYSPCGRPKYSSQILRFSLMLRYTSNSAYNFLKNTFLSQAIHSCVNLSLLRLTTVRPFNVYVIQTVVYQNINKCLSLLAQSQFRVRAIVSDSHTTNVKAYNIHLTNYKYQDKNYKITNPFLSHKNISLLFDTCHLIKNVRNNLVSKRFFDIPAFEFISVNFNISFPPGIYSVVSSTHYS